MPASGFVWVALVPVAITLSSTTVVGGNAVTATIALSAPAPSNVEITLTSGDNAVAQFGGTLAPAIGTSQLVIPAGSLSATFPVRTFGVTAPKTVTLRAASGPNDFGTVSLTVTPAAVRTLAVAPATVAGGATATASLTLDGKAPAAGLTVSLRGAGPVSVPATVSVPGGATSATFAVVTTPVAFDTRASLEAAVDPALLGLRNALIGPARALLLVSAPALSALTLLPPTVVGGAASTARVSLSAPAPAGGLPVTLSTNGPGASVPPTVTVPAGADRLDVAVATTPVPNAQTVTLRATRERAPTSGVTVGIADGSSNTVQIGETATPGALSATLTITPAAPVQALAAFGVRPATVTGGLNALLQVQLATGVQEQVTVTLSTDHPELVTVPASVVLAAPMTLRSVTLKTVPTTAPVTVTIIGTAGTQTVKTALTVTP